MPVGNLSKKQRENFQNPEGFYNALGYKFKELDFARNFWQRGRGKEAHFHKQGKVKHIRIYEDALDRHTDEDKDD